MADGSWDNGGHGVPAKAGMPLWAKIGIGCGVASLLALVTCVGGVVYLRNWVEKDPKGFEKKAMSIAMDTMNLRPDWEDFRQVVDQLKTLEGTRTLYATNPGLHQTWATEAEFLAAAEGWRPGIVSAPELSPDLARQHGLHINKQLGGRVEVGWSPKEGRAVYVTFEAARKPGDTGPRRVTGLEVR
jgi:hypothetical protein